MDSRKEIVLPELSFGVVGAAFDVFNNLGWGFPERNYQNALAEELATRKINFKREVYIPLIYKTSNIGRYFADFIIEDRALLELKVVSKFGYVHAKQVLAYLCAARLRLGILVYFTKDGVKYRRVLNPHSHYLQ
ncbi:MAG: GxxExxY protein [Candidatus Liptonbacteria bacterium]